MLKCDTLNSYLGLTTQSLYGWEGHSSSSFIKLVIAGLVSMMYFIWMVKLRHFLHFSPFVLWLSSCSLCNVHLLHYLLPYLTTAITPSGSKWSRINPKTIIWQKLGEELSHYHPLLFFHLVSHLVDHNHYPPPPF